jgi:hypothetical protein
VVFVVVLVEFPPELVFVELFVVDEGVVVAIIVP